MALSKTANARLVRKARIRKRLRGTSERPRFCVFRSNQYIYAQLVDDDSGKTLAAASTSEKDLKAKVKGTASIQAAKEVGATLASRAKSKSITKVVFDRNGFMFHGRIKALADGAREAGLVF